MSASFNVDASRPTRISRTRDLDPSQPIRRLPSVSEPSLNLTTTFPETISKLVMDLLYWIITESVIALMPRELWADLDVNSGHQ